MKAEIDLAELTELRRDLAAISARLDVLVNTAEEENRIIPLEGLDLWFLPRTQAIQEVLEGANRPMRPIEIWRALHESGRKNDPKMEVQVTTYDLWQRGRIRKLGRGLYCSPRYAEDHGIGDNDAAVS